MKRKLLTSLFAVGLLLVASPVFAATNLLTNGGFEDQNVDDTWQTTNLGGAWTYTTSVSGWSVEWVNPGNTNDPNLEYHSPQVVAGVSDTAEGKLYVELDSHGSTLEPDARVRISQSIETCSTGEYQLSYAWRPRPDGGKIQTHILYVYIDGVLKETHTYDDYTSGWMTETMAFSRTGSDVEIAFEEGGPGDQYGTFLDAVSVVQTKECLLPLEISKTAVTSFTRTYTWGIDKTVDDSDLLLTPGQAHMVTYEVDVTPTAKDSDWGVLGQITIYNPNTVPVTVTSVTDPLGVVTCPDDFGFELAGGANAVCTYEGDLDSGSDTTNTVTVEASGGLGGTAKTGVTFGNPTTVVDDIATVEDSLFGLLGVVHAGDGPATFTYAWMVGPYEMYGDYTVTNKVIATPNDGGNPAEDSITVLVDVPEVGCTLTQGYWKTHSEYGPAPEDDAWYLLGDVDYDLASEGPDEDFFYSGKTYLEVLQTPPTGGNVYYQLAHQYIAARLNKANEAAVPAEVEIALETAQTFFHTNGNTPEKPYDKADVKMLRALASTLGKYNEGMIGPGHCDEQGMTLVQKFDVSAKSNTPTLSADLMDARTYLVKVSGIYKFANMLPAGYGYADAEWALRNDSYADDPLAPHGWTVGELTYPSIVGLDLKINGNNIAWGPFSPTHEYMTAVVGDGGPLSLTIYDSNYNDNSGSLQVKIYEL